MSERIKCCRMNACVLALSLSLLPWVPALAENTVPMPEYPDPNVGCQQYADSRENYREATLKDCLEKDQNGYNELIYYWPKLSQYTASTCVKMMSPTLSNPAARSYAYSFLGGCARDLYYSYDKPREAPVPFSK
jgi:hypothetical protein